MTALPLEGVCAEAREDFAAAKDLIARAARLHVDGATSVADSMFKQGFKRYFRALKAQAIHDERDRRARLVALGAKS